MNWISIGAWLGAAAVVCGAFGAHALKERLGAQELEWWQTAVLYHALHALALCAFGLLAEQRKLHSSWGGPAFLLGICIFSGTLYAMALGAPRILGAVTPFGGVALIVGWIAFARHARKR